MNVIVLLNAISLAAVIVALIGALRIPVRRVGATAKALLSVAVVLYVFVGVSNILEHSGTTARLDAYEDYAEILFFPFLLYFVYALGMHEELARRRRAERRYREVYEGSRDGFVAVDMAGRIVQSNSTFRRMLGYTEMELAEKTYSDITPEAWHEAERRIVEEQVLPRGYSDVYEKEYRRKDGTVFPIEIRTYLLRGTDREPAGMWAFVRDVTARRRAEEEREQLERQLRQSQKMEAVGRLAGGVAHDFNNLLAAIIGYAEIGLGELPADSPIRDDLTEIHTAARRAEALTRQLLAFSRQQLLDVQAVGLNELVLDTERMLSRTLGEDIELVTDLAPEPCTVRADPTQLQEVIINLAVNARDAMPDGGTLTIATRATALDAAAARSHAELEPGPYVDLTVRDTGHGIDEETLARIFEPFFTTKDVGKGTGLGLSTTYGLVKQHGGAIAVESQPGQGATFRILLPRIDAEPEPPAERAREPAAGRGEHTILLAEDEEAVRGMARLALTKHGYTVLAAADGVEALELADAHDGDIDLLLADVVMPRMGGKELADRIVARHPAIRILFMSGYTTDVISKHGVGHPAAQVLQKPFHVDTLVRRVRDALDG